MNKARSCFETDIRTRTKGKGTGLDFMLRLAAGHIHEDPFGAAPLDELRDWIKEKTGAAPEDLRVAEGQSFRLKLIGKF